MYNIEFSQTPFHSSRTALALSHSPFSSYMYFCTSHKHNIYFHFSITGLYTVIFIATFDMLVTHTCNAQSEFSSCVKCCCLATI